MYRCAGKHTGVVASAVVKAFQTSSNCKSCLLSPPPPLKRVDRIGKQHSDFPLYAQARLGQDWVKIGSRLGQDWVKTGSRLGQDWVLVILISKILHNSGHLETADTVVDPGHCVSTQNGTGSF